MTGHPAGMVRVMAARTLTPQQSMKLSRERSRTNRSAGVFSAAAADSARSATVNRSSSPVTPGSKPGRDVLSQPSDNRL